MHMSLARSMDVKRFVVISVLLLWCVWLIGVRVQRTGSGYYVFLLWNLFLACVPLVLSTVLRTLNRLEKRSFWQLGCFGLWLLFLPNAPYILTDLQHLKYPSPAPTWYDVALLISFAGTGLLLGYLSLVDVQEIVARKFGSVCSWLFAVTTLVLTGFALYLGRFLRWNSWDVIVRPGRFFYLGDVMLRGVNNTRPMAVTFVFGTILALGYIAIRVLLARPSTEGLLLRHREFQSTKVDSNWRNL
jgi:uncharacterized membrane protein